MARAKMKSKPWPRISTGQLFLVMYQTHLPACGYDDADSFGADEPRHCPRTGILRIVHSEPFIDWQEADEWLKANAEKIMQEHNYQQATFMLVQATSIFNVKYTVPTEARLFVERSR